MSKPLPRRIPSDDCAVSIDGAEYHPHEGEWVEMMTGMSLGEIKALERFRKASVEYQAAQGEPNETERILGIIDGAFTAICAMLANKIVAWNWTDLRGQPLPPPDGKPEVLERLNVEELMWLLAVAEGQSPSQRKNALPPSPTISSAIESPATGASKSTTARSRMKA
ncbi:MAG: hypothetical protein Q7J84_03970 [Sulfuricaulis sp.]|nr:hypothetical protein [Sulfuricaulis sp.]